MSSKEKTIGMKEGGKPTLVPKLRFPEFRAAEGWQLITLGSVCEILNNRRRPISSSERTPGPYPYYGASGIVDYVADFIFDERLLLVGEDGAKWSAFEKTAFIATGRYWVNNHAHVLKPCGLSDTLLAQYLTLLDLSPFVTGAAPPKLTLGKLKSIPIPLPSKPVEQRKIADCLTSLDEAIAAQARKVDALTKHKKGLMQQLFPREGETQPHLRFPEFRNDRGWAEVRLDKLGELVSGLTYSPDDVRESGLLVLRSSNVQNGRIALDDNVYVDPAIKGANLSQPNDILICVRNGSKALIGKSALIPEWLPLCTHGAFMTVFRAQTPGFVLQLLQTTRYHKQVAGDLGATINSINGSQLLKYKFSIPSLPEQHRIADFLNNLDALLSTETQKLETLMRHKHGLMQQLFPTLVEVEA